MCDTGLSGAAKGLRHGCCGPFSYTWFTAARRIQWERGCAAAAYFRNRS